MWDFFFRSLSFFFKICSKISKFFSRLKDFFLRFLRFFFLNYKIFFSDFFWDSKIFFQKFQIFFRVICPSDSDKKTPGQNIHWSHSWSSYKKACTTWRYEHKYNSRVNHLIILNKFAKTRYPCVSYVPVRVDKGN